MLFCGIASLAFVNLPGIRRPAMLKLIVGPHTLGKKPLTNWVIRVSWLRLGVDDGTHDSQGRGGQV